MKLYTFKPSEGSTAVHVEVDVDAAHRYARENKMLCLASEVDVYALDGGIKVTGPPVEVSDYRPQQEAEPAGAHMKVELWFDPDAMPEFDGATPDPKRQVTTMLADGLAGFKVLTADCEQVWHLVRIGGLVAGSDEAPGGWACGRCGHDRLRFWEDTSEHRDLAEDQDEPTIVFVDMESGTGDGGGNEHFICDSCGTRNEPPDGVDLEFVG